MEGGLRFRDSVVQIFEKAAGMQDLKKAFVLLSSVLDQPLHEEKVAVRYDQSSGEATRYSWKPIKGSWDGRLLMGKHLAPGCFMLEEKDALYEAIRKSLKPGDTVAVRHNGRSVMVRLIPAHEECGGGIAEHLQFYPAKTL